MNIFQLTKALMGIPSVSGEESTVGFFIRDYLKARGWTVEMQDVSESQWNVIAYLNESPRVWMSTHVDTVPPFIPPTEHETTLYGRGAGDAKGLIAAQKTAGEKLKEGVLKEDGLLYTVGEERASPGAKDANL